MPPQKAVAVFARDSLCGQAYDYVDKCDLGPAWVAFAKTSIGRGDGWRSTLHPVPVAHGARRHFTSARLWGLLGFPWVN